MSRVELIDVTRRFGAVEAVAGVNLTIADGEFVTLLGPSGCGKSTTLGLIAGLDEVTSGEIRMAGRRVNELTPFERDVAMVFQQYALYPHMSVAENIGFSLRLRKRSKEDIRRRVMETAELLELTPYLGRLPRELSGGQQQRVALGRAVIREPGVFLFDEPFSNLDAALRTRMRGEVKILHARLGATSIFVTHDQEEVLSISDRIVVMRAGRVEQIGTPKAVYAWPASLYVAGFIGSPPMDILRGVLESENGQVSYRAGSLAFDLAGSDMDRLAHLAPGVDVLLGVRAEHVRLDLAGSGAVVRLAQPLGPTTHVTVD